MSKSTNGIGQKKFDIDTPALLLDLEAMEHNLNHMADFFIKRPVKLRPHVKLHKATPILAHMQLNAGGAVGITCAKLSEAECLAQAGIGDILIANQVVGPSKIRRLVSLATYSDVMVAIENARNAEEISTVAVAYNTKVRVLVEVNIGHHRCGVEPFEPTLELIHKILDLPGLCFMGLMGYDGHCTIKMPASERRACSLKANQLLVDTRTFLEQADINIEIVSAAGTFTYQHAVEVPGITEIQAGTYLLNDTAFYEAGVTEFNPTLTVLATIISRQRREGSEHLAIIDMGRKAIDTYYGLPKVRSPLGVTVTGLSQEHGRVLLEGESSKLDIGNKIEFWVSDANGTINIYDELYAIRGDIVEAVWPIPARGQST
jgi:D-serine deaminase-like pyridoxal phosphate-dependent protein